MYSFYISPFSVCSMLIGRLSPPQLSLTCLLLNGSNNDNKEALYVRNYPFIIFVNKFFTFILIIKSHKLCILLILFVFVSCSTHYILSLFPSSSLALSLSLSFSPSLSLSLSLSPPSLSVGVSYLNFHTRI